MKFTYSNPRFRDFLRITILAGIYYFLLGISNRPLPNNWLLFIVFFLEVFIFYGCISFNNLFIVKKYFKPNFHIQFILLEILMIGTFSLGSFYYQQNISPFKYNPNFDTNYFAELVDNIFNFIFGMALYFMDLWLDEKIYKTNIKLQNKEAELNFLKNQINPHFLLNALNNLYGFALSDPNKVAEKIYELSELLRYQIEAIKKSSIEIEKEVEFIEKYQEYELQKNKSIDFQIDTEGEIPFYRIPPLLYLPLVENAVKYCLESENPFIHIQWNFEKDHVFFQIQNNFDKQYRKTKSTQIGLENLKKRLEFIPLKNEFDIKEENNLYTATLILWIHEKTT